MVSLLLFALLVPPVGPPNPPSGVDSLRLWLVDTSPAVPGGRVRILYEAAQDGNLVLMRRDPAGHVRIIWPELPGQDAIIRGGKIYELRDAKFRLGFGAGEEAGEGLIVAAWSPDQFRLEAGAQSGEVTMDGMVREMATGPYALASVRYRVELDDQVVVSVTWPVGSGLGGYGPGGGGGGGVGLDMSGAYLDGNNPIAPGVYSGTGVYNDDGVWWYGNGGYWWRPWGDDNLARRRIALDPCGIDASGRPLAVPRGTCQQGVAYVRPEAAPRGRGVGRTTPRVSQSIAPAAKVRVPTRSHR